MQFALTLGPHLIATGPYWALLTAGLERELVTLDRNTPRHGEPVVTPRLVPGVRMTVVPGAGLQKRRQNIPENIPVRAS